MIEVSVDSSRFLKDRAVSVGPRLGMRRLLFLTCVKAQGTTVLMDFLSSALDRYF